MCQSHFSYLENNQCHILCNLEDCAHCITSKMNNSICDYENDNFKCDFDGGDYDCQTELYHNGVCDEINNKYWYVNLPI